MFRLGGENSCPDTCSQAAGVYLFWITIIIWETFMLSLVVKVSSKFPNSSRFPASANFHAFPISGHAGGDDSME